MTSPPGAGSFQLPGAGTRHGLRCCQGDLHLEREADEGKHFLHEQSLTAGGHATIELSLARRQAQHLEAPGVAE